MSLIFLLINCVISKVKNNRSLNCSLIIIKIYLGRKTSFSVSLKSTHIRRRSLLFLILVLNLITGLHDASNV